MNSKLTRPFCPCRSRREEDPSSVTEWHNADELVRIILDCGGKRSATPLFERVRIAKPQNHALDDNTALMFDSAPPLRKRRRRSACRRSPK